MTAARPPLGEFPPLIITAHFDAASFETFDGLRRRHFPSHLNKVPAHLSLFHNLPGGEMAPVVKTVADRCREFAPMELQPAGIRFLGRGVALAYQSRELSRLHDELASTWREWLTPQDRQPFKAHITIQNKAEPKAARALCESFEGVALPPCKLVGVTVWRYLAGPWSHVETCLFSAG